jgi:hypothetical protein
MKARKVGYKIMLASKHTIYLTRDYQIVGTAGKNLNTFLFNENGLPVQLEWIKKNIETNEGNFIVLDHKKRIQKSVEKKLISKNYCIESIDLSDTECGFKINPFDLVHDTSEIHFMFLSFLYALWDNSDPDITAMSNLIDAFASCVFFMFSDQKEKLNMRTLKKVVNSVRATCQTENGPIPMSDAIFAGIRDQESMPCKYYAQFKKAANDRWEEVANKVAKVFDMFTENDLLIMEETDRSLEELFRFKTAIFINVENDAQEASAKLLLTLFNYFVQNIEDRHCVMFVIDSLDAHNTMINLPYWMKEAESHNMSFIVMCNDLARFRENKRAERFFNNLKKSISASVLIHFNESAANRDDNLPTTNDEMDIFIDEEYVATVLIPSKNICDQDVVF